MTVAGNLLMAVSFVDIESNAMSAKSGVGANALLSQRAGFDIAARTR